jgi:hypothetical protein
MQVENAYDLGFHPNMSLLLPGMKMLSKNVRSICLTRIVIERLQMNSEVHIGAASGNTPAIPTSR